MKFDLDDVLIIPEIVSSIESRYKDVNVYYGAGTCQHLPVVAAPMDTVISNNQGVFNSSFVPVCIPRTSAELPDKRLFNLPNYKSYSLDEFIYMVNNYCLSKQVSPYLLIDIANGHMSKLYKALDGYKKSAAYGHINIAIGNIANPLTYKFICENYPWVHAVRIGIGNGNGCLTTQQTGVGYPMGSLISECRKIQKELSGPIIIADGGMKSYADIIKALALGAQYVMIGSIFNKCLESSGETRLFGFKIKPSGNLAKWAFKKGLPIYKIFRGMSTKQVQQTLGTKPKTSEGIVTKRKVEYTLESWTENFRHYLASAMSYTNSRTLEEFIGNVEYYLISEASVSRYRK